MHLIMLTLSPKQNFFVYLECNYQMESIFHQGESILKNEKPMFPSSKHFTSFFFFFPPMIPYGSPWKMPCIMKDYTFRGDYLFRECPTPTRLSYRLLDDDLLFMGISRSTHLTPGCGGMQLLFEVYVPNNVGVSIWCTISCYAH
jgi:hypothetical protein